MRIKVNELHKLADKAVVAYMRISIVLNNLHMHDVMYSIVSFIRPGSIKVNWSATLITEVLAFLIKAIDTGIKCEIIEPSNLPPGYVIGKLLYNQRLVAAVLQLRYAWESAARHVPEVCGKPMPHQWQTHIARELKYANPYVTIRGIPGENHEHLIHVTSMTMYKKLSQVARRISRELPPGGCPWDTDAGAPMPRLIEPVLVLKIADVAAAAGDVVLLSLDYSTSGNIKFDIYALSTTHPMILV
jgi:hypothetical protein